MTVGAARKRGGIRGGGALLMVVGSGDGCERPPMCTGPYSSFSLVYTLKIHTSDHVLMQFYCNNGCDNVLQVLTIICAQTKPLSIRKKFHIVFDPLLKNRFFFVFFFWE